MKAEIYDIKKLIPDFNKKVFVIAEVGINHEGDFRKCCELILQAKKSGADAVKLQTIDPELNYCEGSDSYSIFEKSKLSRNETKKIFSFCKNNKIKIFTTFGDEETMDWILRLNPFGLKISSGLLSNYPLVKKIIANNLPVFFSTGMANKNDLLNIKKLIKKYKKKNVAALHCISLYPTPKRYLNFDYINFLKNYFKIPVGYSDHTTSQEVPALSVLAGAVVVEKHFTFDENRAGFDHAISFSSKKFTKMVKQIRKFEEYLIKNDFRNIKKLQRRKFSRCIVASKNLTKGFRINKKSVLFKRPLDPNLRGIDPLYVDKLVGKILNKTILKDQPITYKDFYE